MEILNTTAKPAENCNLTDNGDTSFNSPTIRIQNSNNKLHLAQRGLQLLELLIGIAIVGVLISIAIPGYNSYVEKAKIEIAKTDITEISILIERFYITNQRYPDSLAEVGADGMLDPWDRPYRYLRLFEAPENRNHARKDHSLHPINTDFDLYSVGKDGRTVKPLTGGPSKDDIVRANNGGYLGLGKDY